MYVFIFPVRWWHHLSHALIFIFPIIFIWKARTVIWLIKEIIVDLWSLVATLSSGAVLLFLFNDLLFLVRIQYIIILSEAITLTGICYQKASLCLDIGEAFRNLL